MGWVAFRILDVTDDVLLAIDTQSISERKEITFVCSHNAEDADIKSTMAKQHWT